MVLVISIFMVWKVPAGTVIAWVSANVNVTSPVKPKLISPVFTGMTQTSPTLTVGWAKYLLSNNKQR